MIYSKNSDARISLANEIELIGSGPYVALETANSVILPNQLLTFGPFQ